MRHGPALLLVMLLGGCSSLDYYAQSVHGQLGVMAASRPTEEVIADPQTPEQVRAKLQALPTLRRFSVEQLALPETESYRLYADLQREAMVWSLVAAPVDSLRPREWCYPVVGCAAYRGYFDPTVAHEVAASLSAEGWDTAVEPVPAYSTLGWFSDPLPSTVIDWPLSDIAALLFHELAHQALYVAGDSAFNEAYATVVEKEGVRRWLERFGDAQQREVFELRERRRHDFLKLLSRTRERLDELYASGAEAQQLLQSKADTLRLLQLEYAALKQSWGGSTAYDRWMQRPLNNAHLASVNTYHALEPAFRQILQQTGGDMASFHKACAEIASLAPEQRDATMDGLLKAAGGG